jgi:DASS family divalent anion:Na+ symporter
MDKDHIIKWAAVIGIPVILLLLPVPGGFTPDAWHLFAIYVGAILGIMLRPLPEPAMILIVITIASMWLNKMNVVLSGYSNGTAWLVFTAFSLSAAFATTGLGARIAYILIGKIGKSSLGLGYAMMITDTIISPATPSNTARTAGIVYPIFRSLSSTLGSEPGPTGRKIGCYLNLLAYEISMTTCCLFITATASNIIVLHFAKDILHTDISWMTWAMAAFVPIMLVLLTIPYIVYKLYPPEIKHVDNYKEISKTGLEKLGPISRKEKTLAVLFILAIIGWATTSLTGFNATAIAIAFVAAALVTGVLTWQGVLKTSGAWSTFMWYGGIIGMATALNQSKFFDSLATVINSTVDLSSVNPFVAFAIILLVSVVTRYIFASTAAFATSFVPVLFTIGTAANLPAIPLTLMLGICLSWPALLTHYGGACGPVLFGYDYVDQVTWWKVGTIITVLHYIVTIGIGIPYWKLLGLY